MNEAKTRAVEKLYDRIANGDKLTDKEYEFINNYEIECYLAESKKNKNNTIDDLIKNGTKITTIIDKLFPMGDGK